MVHAEYVVVFAIYFAAMLGIGFYFWKRNKDMDDYVLGGRTLGPWVAAFSAQASDMSGWMFLALPGAVFAFGLGKIWIGVGLIIGSYLAWLLIAKRIRIYSHITNNSLTLPEFLSNRFHDETGRIRFYCAIVVLVFFTFYVTSGLVSAATVFSSIFYDSVSYEWAVVISAGVIMLYTMMGGFKAVCWTDFFQAILMITVIIVVPLVAFNYLGSDMSVIVERLDKEIANFANIFYVGGSPITAAILFSSLAWGLGYFGIPHVISRYMAMKEPKDVKVARRVSLVWGVVALSCAVLVGFLGRAWYISQFGTVDPGFDPETIFYWMTANLFAPLAAAVIFAGLMAAIMSSADSQLLVASSTITNDFIKDRYKNFSDEKMIRLSRYAVIGVSAIAMIIAINRNMSIMSLVAFAWSGLGAAFGPSVICALYWKRSTKKGAMAAMVVGFVTVIVWNTFFVADGILPQMFGVDACIFDTGIYELLPGFIFGLIAMIVVSHYTEQPSVEMQEEYDRFERQLND